MVLCEKMYSMSVPSVAFTCASWPHLTVCSTVSMPAKVIEDACWPFMGWHGSHALYIIPTTPLHLRFCLSELTQQ